MFYNTQNNGPSLIEQAQYYNSKVDQVKGLVAATIEPFVRTNFGDDYYTGLRITLGLAMMSAYAFAWGMYGALGVGFKLFIGLFLIVAIIQRARAGWLWRNRGENTEFMGFSWAAYLKPDLHRYPMTFYTWAEPAIVLVIALIAFQFDKALGIWLAFGASALRSRNVAVYKDMKRMIKLYGNATIIADDRLGRRHAAPPNVSTAQIVRAKTAPAAQKSNIADAVAQTTRDTLRS